MLWTWDAVWCCLNFVESGVATALFAHWYDLTFYVDKSEFDTLWAIVDSNNNPLRKQAFIDTFHLISSTRVDENEDVIPIWAFNGAFWANLTAASETGLLDCEDPCKLIPPWL